MKKKKSNNGLFALIWFIVVAGAIVAFLQVVNPGNIWEKAKIKSAQIGVLVNRCVADFDNCGGSVNIWWNNDGGLDGTIALPDLNTNTTSNSNKQNSNQDNQQTSQPVINNNSNSNQGFNNIVSTTKEQLLNQLNSLKEVKEYNQVNYSRREWKHWSNYNGNSCWNVREEALYRQAEPNSIVLLDSNKNVTSNKDNACSIKSGKWVDPYSNEIITDPQKTDLDHTSALAATARAGGQSWDSSTKEKFANDLDHLVITSQKQNRTKSDKTPSEWMPENKSAHCGYAKIYVNILHKYNLQVSTDDKDVLTKALSSCN